MAGTGLNAVTGQRPARRTYSIEKVRKELNAWENMRNNDCGKVIRHFTAEYARNKLISLSPKFELSGE